MSDKKNNDETPEVVEAEAPELHTVRPGVIGYDHESGAYVIEQPESDNAA